MAVVTNDGRGYRWETCATTCPGFIQSFGARSLSERQGTKELCRARGISESIEERLCACIGEPISVVLAEEYDGFRNLTFDRLAYLGSVFASIANDPDFGFGTGPDIEYPSVSPRANRDDIRGECYGRAYWAIQGLGMLAARRTINFALVSNQWTTCEDLAGIFSFLLGTSAQFVRDLRRNIIAAIERDEERENAYHRARAEAADVRAAQRVAERLGAIARVVDRAGTRDRRHEGDDAAGDQDAVIAAELGLRIREYLDERAGEDDASPTGSSERSGVSSVDWIPRGAGSTTIWIGLHVRQFGR